MVSVPNTFTAGQQAKAAEVNENFTALADAIGEESDVENLAPPGSLVLGPRKNIQLQAKHDDGDSARRFLHIGWNAELYKTGSLWKYRRYLSSNPATSFRIGPMGFEVWTTSSTSGDLNSQLSNVMAMRISTGDDYLYLKPKIQSRDGDAQTIQDFRSTYVFLHQPQTIYDDQALTAATTVFKATDFGIPNRATGIAIAAEVLAGSKGGSIRFKQERDGRANRFGWALRPSANEWASGWGVVALGRDGYANKFVIERGVSFANAHVYIVGYFW